MTQQEWVRMYLLLRSATFTVSATLFVVSGCLIFLIQPENYNWIPAITLLVLGSFLLNDVRKENKKLREQIF